MMINVITPMHPIKSTSINKYYILGLSLIPNHLAVPASIRNTTITLFKKKRSYEERIRKLSGNDINTVKHGYIKIEGTHNFTSKYTVL